MALGNKNPLVGSTKVIDLGGSSLVVLEATLGAYATNGIALTPSDFGLRSLDFVLPVCAGAGYTLAWDQANSKVKVFGQPAAAGAGAHTEVANATDLSGVKAYLLAIGKR